MDLYEKYHNSLFIIKVLVYNNYMERIDYLREKVKELPLTPGVYKMYDKYGNIIYIGKAKKLKNRVSSYFVNTKKAEKVAQMVANVFDFDYIVTTSEFEALNLESNLIHAHQPFYNILLKDGKAFPYIKINTKSKFPKVEITRKVKKDGSLYFGPFFNNIKASELYDIINNTFKLRDCNIIKTNRECLNYQLGICMAPCTKRCSESEYNDEVKKVINFLKGDLSEAKRILTEKMMQCAEVEQFERAIEYKNNLKIIEKINEKQVSNLSVLVDADIFGFASTEHSAVVSVLVVRGGKMVGLNNYNVVNVDSEQNLVESFVSQYYIDNIIPKIVVIPFESEIIGEYLNSNSKSKVEVVVAKRGKYKKLLDLAILNAKQDLEKSISKDKLKELKTIGAMKTLQESLKLKRIPYRIEGYDISHISGTNTVASMVVFTGGEPNKAHYRKFKINIDKPNDFECMKEILTRRIGEYGNGDVSFDAKPDLILIDGGKGQLSYAFDVITREGFNADMLSLAEKNEEVYKPNESEPYIFARNNFGLKLLQNVRDEAHRFAITFHKNTRNKNTLKSKLLSIRGVGEASVNALYDYFKSYDNIKNASLLELTKVKGITKSQAVKIYEFFNS